MLRTPRRLLLLAGACLLGLALTGVLAYLVPVTHARDSATLQGFRALDRPRLTPVLGHIAHLCNPTGYAFIGSALVAVALLRRRPRVAVLVCALLGATGWTTQQLKPLLASPRYDEWLGAGQIAPASWPSGHATAAMTLALCAVLVAPVRLRGSAAALGAAFAVAVSYAVLALGWHFPSDVFGGYLVAATWTALGVAGLAALEQRWPSRVRSEAPAARAHAHARLGLGAGALALAVLAVLGVPEQASEFAAARTSFVAGASAIAALAVALALGLARGVRSA